MSINSKAKGCRGEREFAQLMRDHGYSDARRGQQFCGSNGDADVVGIPGIHIEVKRVQALNIDRALKQAQNDAKDGETPIVAHRKNGEKWKITMDAEDWFRLLKRADPDFGFV